MSKEVIILAKEDCGNAPKKKILLDFNVAFAKNDIDYLSGIVSDDITWDMVGDKVIHGKAQFLESLEQMADVVVTELHIKDIITHGNVGSAHGTLTFDDGAIYAFCDVYKFGSFSKNAKIKEITSYVIRTN